MQRCIGTDALNAIAVVSYDCDQATGTKYHERFNRYLSIAEIRSDLQLCADRRKGEQEFQVQEGASAAGPGYVPACYKDRCGQSGH